MAIPFSAIKVMHPLEFPHEPKVLPTHLRDDLLARPFLSDRKVVYLAIEDSFHYRALETNDFTKYNEYIQVTDQKDNSEQQFKELYNSFSLESMKPVEAIASPSFDFFYIVDGVHRLSIAKFKGLFGDTIPLKYIHVTFSKTFLRVTQQSPMHQPVLQGRKAWDPLLDVLRATVAKPKYNGWTNQTQFGYHSFDIYDFHVRGQRNPLKRFEKIKKHVQLAGKVVLDLGCNTGGMLLHIPEVKTGIGVDYDADCIAAANLMKRKFNFAADFRFFQKDLNELNILEFCKEQGVEPDCIFLLSLGSWVKEWPTLYTQCFQASKSILLETNNDQEGEPQLQLFEQLGSKRTLVSTASDDDCTGNARRKTYFIEKV